MSILIESMHGIVKICRKRTDTSRLVYFYKLMIKLTSLQLLDIFKAWQNIILNYPDQRTRFFYSFEFFYGTAEYYTGLNLLSYTETSFLRTCSLVAWKESITVWEQCHGTVSYTLQIYQPLNTLPAPCTVFLKWSECLAFVVWYFNLPARRIASKWQELFIFFPISAYGIVLAPAVIQQDIFRIHGAQEKPATAIPAFGECDKGINHPFTP